MKRYSLALIVCLLFVVPTSAFAVDTPEWIENSQKTQVDVLESSETFEVPSLNYEISRVPEKVWELKGYDNISGKVVDKEKYKESLLEFFDTDPVKYAESRRIIDSIVNEALDSKRNNNLDLPRDISPQSMVIIAQGWKTKPFTTSTNNYVTYATSWITEDNYRSSVPITVNYTKKTTVSASLGFTGPDVLKKYLGVSGSFDVVQESTISQGATVPAWTAWGYRPYIKWKETNWKGTYYITYSAAGRIYTIDEEQTGTNKDLLTKSNEYKSYTNSSKNTNATTPSFPTTKPNV